jgi:hypothetical protein
VSDYPVRVYRLRIIERCDLYPRARRIDEVLGQGRSKNHAKVIPRFRSTLVLPVSHDDGCLWVGIAER